MAEAHEPNLSTSIDGCHNCNGRDPAIGNNNRTRTTSSFPIFTHHAGKIGPCSEKCLIKRQMHRYCWDFRNQGSVLQCYRGTQYAKKVYDWRNELLVRSGAVEWASFPARLLSGAGHRVLFDRAIVAGNLCKTSLDVTLTAVKNRPDGQHLRERPL